MCQVYFEYSLTRLEMRALQTTLSAAANVQLWHKCSADNQPVSVKGYKAERNIFMTYLITEKLLNKYIIIIIIVSWILHFM